MRIDNKRKEPFGLLRVITVEAFYWAKSILLYSNYKLRNFVVVPTIIFFILFAIGEVTGIEVFLWVLLGSLFSSIVLIVYFWPLVVAALSVVPQTRTLPQIFIAGFLALLCLILIGFAVPFHNLDPFILRVLPIIGLIAIVLAWYYEFLANPRKADFSNFVLFLKWFFLLVVIATIVMSFTWEEIPGYIDELNDLWNDIF